MDDYVILRSPGRGTSDFGTPRTRDAGTPGPFETGDGDLMIDVERMDHRDAIDLAGDPSVQAFAPSMPMTLHEPFEGENLPASDAGNTWGIEAIGAHTSDQDGAGVVVAVLDTGIDPDHEAFAGVDLVRRNFTAEGDDDTNGHGTHCAGTIFGRDVNGCRIGVARGVEQAYIAKVLGQGGGGSDTLIQAMQWALDNGANVISMSLGIDFPGYVNALIQQDWPADLATSRALEGYRANLNLFGAFGELAQMRGPFGRPTVIVAASGNESRRSINPDYEIAVAPPAAAQDLIAVGALGQGPDGYAIAPFSNVNVDLAGPGVSVSSAAVGGGLTSLSGTSMATPHVAGAAALWAQRISTTQGLLTPGAMRARLIGSGTYAGLDPTLGGAAVGTGMVQAPQP
ncbi:MAG: S8 family serine peptidase [Actinomycetota bacterium]